MEYIIAVKGNTLTESDNAGEHLKNEDSPQFKNMKNKMNNWTSYNEQNRNLNRKAEINRLRKHNFLLEVFIAGCVGASIALTFVIVHMMVTGPAWTW